jgi:acetyl-CoA synthase
VPFDNIIQKSIEVRGLKIKIDKVPIPVAYGAAFEGERIRKDDLYCEFGGSKSEAFELLRMKEMDEVEDNKIELIGKDFKDMEEKKAYPLAVLVDVAGRRCRKTSSRFSSARSTT